MTLYPLSIHQWTELLTLLACIALVGSGSGQLGPTAGTRNGNVERRAGHLGNWQGASQTVQINVQFQTKDRRRQRDKTLPLAAVVDSSSSHEDRARRTNDLYIVCMIYD